MKRATIVTTVLMSTFMQLFGACTPHTPDNAIRAADPFAFTTSLGHDDVKPILGSISRYRTRTGEWLDVLTVDRRVDTVVPLGAYRFVVEPPRGGPMDIAMIVVRFDGTVVARDSFRVVRQLKGEHWCIALIVRYDTLQWKSVQQRGSYFRLNDAFELKPTLSDAYEVAARWAQPYSRVEPGSTHRLQFPRIGSEAFLTAPGIVTRNILLVDNWISVFGSAPAVDSIMWDVRN